MREQLKSRLGFLMLAAGSAVGLGNVWRFPYIVGKNGGAAFVIIYLAFLALLGFPLLAVELGIGRGAQRSLAAALPALAPARTRGFWSRWGAILASGCFVLMIYYTDVAGWLLKYTGDFALGRPADDPGAAFVGLLANPAVCGSFMGLAVLAATLVCLLGVVKGVERVTKVMMLTLLALLGILAVRSLTLPGAAEGLRFYLKPDWSQFLAHPGEVIFVALPQVFAQMAGGRFWGFLFFLFLACAALTTVIAVFECLIAGLMDSLGMKRLKATLLTGCGVALLSLPCVLWDGVLKWEDFAVSQLWLPLGALTQGFFVVNGRWGWGWENYRASVSAGTGWNLPAWIKYHYAVLIPILIAAVLIAGLVTFDYR